ncbi:hypothetical protein FOQG_18987 [Fusarium oxysporum f. sp. raphani 54005]|uniref:Uncharacterized protein n=1 Tax=Fusarium oxysporum f. sp. raphani 54005 TaxID=1089458 RepID=X0BBS8_FUSOX|nr:hypothetical protein FOQG_18987 [Fusarium oxysporum f. sp. raphani 54005]
MERRVVKMKTKTTATMRVVSWALKTLRRMIWMMKMTEMMRVKRKITAGRTKR